jgi:hypothetical protein
MLRRIYKSVLEWSPSSWRTKAADMPVQPGAVFPDNKPETLVNI